MTTDGVGKILRSAGRRDDLLNVHVAYVNTIHDALSTANVQPVHTDRAALCHNADEMPPDTATRLRQLRRARRLTQEDVAAAVGVDRSMISKMEKGVPGGRELVVHLAEYYGVSLDWLLNEDNASEAIRTSPLSDTEAQMLEYYRTLSKDVAEAFLKSMQAAAKKQ